MCVYVCESKVLRIRKFSTFEPNLGCRAENSSNFKSAKISYFSLKVGSGEMNHAAIGDLKNGGRCIKRES